MVIIIICADALIAKLGTLIKLGKEEVKISCEFKIFCVCVGMTWKPPTDSFKVEPSGWSQPSSSVAPWSLQPAQQPPNPILEAYQTDELLKKKYGIELAKAVNPFEAACKLFNEADTHKALWISFHWIGDPVVAASRDVYLKIVELSAPVLDRQQIAAKALAIADEKVLKNGVMVPTVEAKDRLAAIRLYSDIIGYTGKVEIDNSVNNNTINEITVKLVKADPIKPVVVIDNTPNLNVKSQMTHLQLVLNW